MQRNLSNVKLAILVAVLSAPGCSTTDPSQSDLILQQLLSIPTFTPPIQTTENVNNPGFILTDSTYTEIIVLLDNCYRRWIQSIQEDEIKARKDRSGYQWRQQPAPSGYSAILLSVIPGDTLFFKLEFESIQWTNYLVIQGWVCPSLSYGQVDDSAPYWRMNWETTDTVHIARYYVPSMYEPSHYIVVVDSISGGGLIDVFEWDHHIKANWDLHGHGSWLEMPGDIIIEW